MGSIAQKLTPRSQEWTTKMPGPLSGWTDSRAFPPLAKQSFSERWAKENGRSVNQETGKPVDPLTKRPHD
jgi:hypothetical protein